MNVEKLTLFCGILMAIVPAVAVGQSITEFEPYTVKKGDTCTTIAEKFFGDKRRYDYIHAYNDLSGDNYACVPGRELRIPKLPPVPDALVGQKAGDVRARGPQQSNWDEAKAGMDLYSAWRLNTMDEARAEIAFQDTSTLVLSPNTLIIIYGESREKAQVTPAKTVLESGRLRSKLDQLAGVTVESPSSTVIFGTGEAQMTVEESGLTRVANHAGDATRVTGKAGGNVNVKAGMGTRIKPNEKPEPPRPLPATPVWKNEGGLALGVGGAGATITLAWEPVAEARSYYVELARDARGIDVVESVLVPADKTNLAIKGVPAGTFYAVVSSVDADKFESIPAPVRHIRSTVVVAPDKAVHLDEAGRAHAVLGTEVRSPRGVNCRVADGDFGEKAVFNLVGEADLECRLNDQVGMTTVIVDAPASTRLDERTLSTESFRVVKIGFSPAAPAGVEFTANGADVDVAVPTADGYAIKLRAHNENPVTLTAKFGQTSLGTFEFSVDKRAALPTQDPDIFRLHLMPGWAYYDTITTEDISTTGATVHFQASLIPTQYIGVAGSLGAGQYDNAVLDWRVMALVGLFESNIRPFIGIGPGGVLVEDYLSTLDIVVGIMPSISDHYGINVDVGGISTSKNGEFKTAAEARVGLWWSFR